MIGIGIRHRIAAAILLANVGGSLAAHSSLAGEPLTERTAQAGTRVAPFPEDEFSDDYLGIPSMVPWVAKWLNKRADRQYEIETSGPPTPRPFDHLYEASLTELAEKADAGDGAAAYVLGDLFDQGDEERGLARDTEKAMYWYQRAVTLNNSDALNNLGSMYHHGDGLPQDIAKARDYYERAAAAGNGVAIGNLARMYIEGEAGLEKDPPKARAMLTQAAELGDPNAMVGLGYDWNHAQGGPGDVRRAFYWYRRAAQYGDASGAYNMGVAYWNGYDVFEDKAEAVALFQRAYMLGSTSASYFLGVAYQLGSGVEPDAGKALLYLTEAEESGDSDAADALKRLRAAHPELE